MKSMHEMTIEELREEGYAVVIFTPSELENADPDRVEDGLVAAGWDIIEVNQEEEEEEEQE